MFSRLGEVNPEKLKNMGISDQEACQFITWASFQKNMHLVFGLKNYYFAKMFYGFLVSYQSFATVVNFQQWTEKLYPFWMKKEPEELVDCDDEFEANGIRAAMEK